MAVNIGFRVKSAWNAFLNKDPTNYKYDYGYSSGLRTDRPRLSRGNERSIYTTVLTRIAVDCSQYTITHARLDSNGSYTATIDDDLNQALTLSANVDQTGTALMRDIVLSMFDEGCVAIVPTDTDVDPRTNIYKIQELRVGRIVQWYPMSIRVSVYNERSGKKEEIMVPKESTAIIENPFFSIMNEPSSTLQRLIHKLNLLDAIDEQSSASKLDLIIQLPYVIKSDARRQQAEKRRKDIEEQLAGSKYGIAYTDGTEHITQLNRSLDNNLMTQIEYLTKMLYSQLGMTEEIMNGTASDEVMTNYYSRIIEPILTEIVGEMKRKFLTKTAITQGQSIIYMRDPFKLVPISKVADIADKFTRNEILSSNELRSIIGRKPVDDARANELRNKNINANSDTLGNPVTTDGSEGAIPPGSPPPENYSNEDGVTDESIAATMARLTG